MSFTLLNDAAGEIASDPMLPKTFGSLPSTSACGWWPSTIRIDVATRSLRWERCVVAPGTEYSVSWISGEKALSDSQLATVLAAYAQLTPGVTKSCAELRDPTLYTSIVTVEGDGTSHSLYSEEGSCWEGASGGAPWVGLDQLQEAVVGLLP
jgi:hypothetical protein